jgi:hypothetical protein
MLSKNQSSQPNSPDFSAIDSLAKAEDLFRLGQLENLFLMPLEFGGVDNPMNILYVPIGISEIKDGIDRNVIAKLAEEGTISEYRAIPEYQGKSFIPIAIRIEASNPGQFSTLIKIWGDALAL